MSAGGMVVVGAGECGVRAAFTLREAGWTGPVTLVGAEPGDPYERPPLSKGGGVRPICTAATLREQGITYRSGVRVTGLDPAAHTVTLDDGVVFGYERLLLATGARPRPLPVPGPAHLLRSRADAESLLARLTSGARIGVVGGGFIGLEVACTAAARGCEVTVFEAGPQLMGRAVPGLVAEFVAQRHRTAGLDVRCATGVDGVEPAGSGAVVLAGGRRVEVDVVVAGIGAVPRTGLAERAGLALAGATGGIEVDGRFATSAPDVFAAGDCCSFPHPLFDGRRLRLESWRAAQEQGAHAARAMLGADEAYAGVPWFWSDQGETTLQVAGLPAAARTECLRRRPDGALVWFGLDRSGRLVAAAGAGTGTVVAKDVRLAEMLIARAAAPDPAALADPGQPLKPLLAAHRARAA